MENVISYIDELAEQTMEKTALNEVDLLIFAQIAYLDFKDIVPGICEEGKSIYLRGLLSHPARCRMYLDKWFGMENLQLLYALSESRRYNACKLEFYSNVYDRKRETQFAAVTVMLEKSQYCIAFRGTDESIIGWKEDCNLTFLEKIPAQELAATYLRQVAARTTGQLYVVGHSKGGNLAEYASLHVPQEIQTRICAVYNFDGPGNPCASDEFDKKGQTQRTVYSWEYFKYTTKQSLIGSFWDEPYEGELIESRGIGLMQHNPFNWIVQDNKFLRAKCDKKCRSMTEELLRHWILHMEVDERKRIIERFFEYMLATGEQNLIQIDWKNYLWKFLITVKEKHGETL